MISDVISALLTVISFLIGTASIVLGFYVPQASKLSNTQSYYKRLILFLLIPSMVLIIVGATFLIQSGIYSSLPISETVSYGIIFGVLVIPEIIMVDMINRPTLA